MIFPVTADPCHCFKVMAQQGGSVEGLRARGNAEVSVSWLPVKQIRDGEGTDKEGGDREVRRAEGRRLICLF